MEGPSVISYGKNQVVGAFFVGLVIGLGAYYVWDNQGSILTKKEGIPVYDEEKNEGINSVTESKNSITVSDQLAGLVVTVDRVVLAQSGWLVIQEERDGKPASLLGAGRKDAGTYEQVPVELLRNTEEGNIYYAVIYIDDGDRQFDNKKDMPIITRDGNPVMDAFEIVRK